MPAQTQYFSIVTYERLSEGAPGVYHAYAYCARAKANKLGFYKTQGEALRVGTTHKCTTAQAICQQTADTYEQKVLLISYKQKAST